MLLCHRGSKTASLKMRLQCFLFVTEKQADFKARGEAAKAGVKIDYSEAHTSLMERGSASYSLRTIVPGRKVVLFDCTGK